MEDEWEDETAGNHLDDGYEEVGAPDGVGGVGPGMARDVGISDNGPWGPIIPGTTRLVVVTSSGVFRRLVRWCECPGKAEPHIQLLRMELFSATIKKPSTAFTFDVLDHFHIDAMECKTAALNFYNKLRRLTNNAFPATTPVCVRNIMSMCHD
jgi:hypothetical protein